MTTNKHTALPWVVELNPTIPEGLQVSAFEADGEMAGNRHLQVIVKSHNLDADAELIVEAVNNYGRLRDECDALRAECEKLRKDAERYQWLRDGNNEEASEATIIAANFWGDKWDDMIDDAMEPPTAKGVSDAM